MTDAPAPRLLLITPVLAEIDAFEATLESAVLAGDVAAVVIRLAPADERTLLARAKALVSAVQSEGAAALLAGDGVEEIVGRSGADGVHVATAVEAIEAIERFAPEKIVGCGPLVSRDEAMSVGEAGADYVLFGADDADFEQTLERVGWWVPIFQTPCVGVAATIDDVSALARENVEFVGLGDAVWRNEAGPAAAVAAAEAMLSLARAPGS
ncbi:thiamine phosphate synthase [Chenggangzhangella methanolivorans]|uniref:Thiamine phosphate synthase n=1 Tax=Chenggangzhangella methanolivorans TaxID=1437009 RepID=A0A9E6RAV3_9HYPH|nr:thiamine phosphate synthase [Chenggangzhangella methanolivorans]QZO01388.1 thiamine phosphate synthase [Chenggangzhangella methanolivorans]